MRLKLHLLLALMPLMMVSCSIFGDDDKDIDEELGRLSFDMEFDLIAGQSMGLAIRDGQANIVEVLIDGTKMERLDESSGNYQYLYRVPENLKGEYQVSAKVTPHSDDANSRTIDVGVVWVHQFVGDAYPGVAFRVDLSDAHTVLCAMSSAEEGSGHTWTAECHSFKFAAGKSPVQAKFYDAKGTQVPATFTAIKDISDELFFAKMCNARPYDPFYDVIYSSCILFDRDNFTCQARMDLSDVVNVVVNKKTGIIARLIPKQENTYVYIDENSVFQGMENGVMCVMEKGFGGEFATGKLMKFNASDIINAEAKEGDWDKYFQYNVSIEVVQGQDNLDILNGWNAHWIALSPDDVLFNRERALRRGQLSSIEFPSSGSNMFGCYGQNDFYCISETGIYNTNGVSITSSTEGVYNVEIYQFPDSTLVRSNDNSDNQEERFLNHYSFTKNGLKLYKEKIVGKRESYDIMTGCYPIYPCTNNYEYILLNNGKDLYRRPLKAIYRSGEEQLVSRDIPSLGLLSSASKNAITFIDRNEPFNLTSESVSRIIEFGPGGELVQSISMDKGLMVTGVCRFKD